MLLSTKDIKNLNKMELVIDANILISALISNQGATYDLMFKDDLRLFAPEYLLEEFEEHKKEIREKSGLSKEELHLFLSLVSNRINFIPYLEFESFVENAEKITPDLDDTEYFALALKLNCSIWSNDKKLKNQKGIKIYSTTELLELI